MAGTKNSPVPRAGIHTVHGTFTNGPKGRAALGRAKAANTRAANKFHKTKKSKAGAGSGGSGH